MQQTLIASRRTPSMLWVSCRPRRTISQKIPWSTGLRSDASAQQGLVIWRWISLRSPPRQCPLNACSLWQEWCVQVGQDCPFSYHIFNFHLRKEALYFRREPSEEGFIEVQSGWSEGQIIRIRSRNKSWINPIKIFIIILSTLFVSVMYSLVDRQTDRRTCWMKSSSSGLPSFHKVASVLNPDGKLRSHQKRFCFRRQI